METLNELLAAVVEKAEFEIRRTEVTDDGENIPVWSRRVSAPELREFYFGQQDQVVRSSVSVLAPETLKSQLVDALRQFLKDFVDPETDRIGHAFPTEVNNSGRSATRADGLHDEERTSPLPNFSDALVQAAAIMGVDRATRLLTGWICGEPIRLHLSTVLNNLFLDVPVSPRDDIRVVPLPLTTADLPRLPLHGRTRASDYLGLALLRLELSASPVLFRPKTDNNDQTISSRAVDGINLDLICEALSLQANSHVSKSVIWCDYPDAPGFCLRIPQTWSMGDDRLRQAPMEHGLVSHGAGGATMTLKDGASLQRLDEIELRRTLEALMRVDRKLRIAVDRWRRSQRPNAMLEDAYIDLRVALETLYLKDFINEHSQEMRFRLALFGAWHLGEEFEERRSIRKTLRDAYDTASKAVHLGELPREAKGGLSDAQDLCRRGILKLLHEGPPPDWGDLLLGG